MRQLVFKLVLFEKGYSAHNVTIINFQNHSHQLISGSNVNRNQRCISCHPLLFGEHKTMPQIPWYLILWLLLCLSLEFSTSSSSVFSQIACKKSRSENIHRPFLFKWEEKRFPSPHQSNYFIVNLPPYLLKIETSLPNMSQSGRPTYYPCFHNNYVLFITTSNALS